MQRLLSKVRSPVIRPISCQLVIGARRDLCGEVQDEDRELVLPPPSIEAQHALVEVALEVLGVDTVADPPQSQALRCPKTVCAQRGKWAACLCPALARAIVNPKLGTVPRTCHTDR